MRSNLPPGVTNSMIEDQVSSGDHLHDALVETLEHIVDTNCLYEVIQCLIEVCYAKEDYLRSAWGDDYQAGLWRSASLQLEKLNVKV